MFRHKGNTRTLQHNLRLASLLSFVAGIVNVAGFLSVQRMTTNVTGHFAFLVDEVLHLNFWTGFIFFMYIFSFFLGSFCSKFIVELVARKNDNLIYVIPTVIESILLFSAAACGQFLVLNNANLLVCSLLFIMGLQNSLVTTISNSVVRTTHLTGLFTDLGIELSQLFFYKLKEQKEQLHSSIKLRLTIISFFFLGGLSAGLLYSKIKLHVLAIAGIILLIGIIYDELNQKSARQIK
ncbi:MAG: YoaK family protein [Flavobacteriales bacterium]